MAEPLHESVADIVLRLAIAGIIGGFIGFERRAHHRAIGVAGMMLIAVGSATYMLLAKHLAATDPAAISRALQGLLSGIGFFGGAAIFKSGMEVRGIKAAAAVWISGAVGLAIGTAYWWLGAVVGVVTVAILWVSDAFPDPVRERRQEEPTGDSDSAETERRGKR